MRRILFSLFFGLFLVSCVYTVEDFGGGYGKRPIYISADSLDHVTNLPPQPIALAGTIFWSDSLFFVLEHKKGVHVYNAIDSNNTEALTFIQIPAITDFTISGGYMYADGWKDLLIIDIHDIQHATLVSRTPNAFDPLLFPPLYNGPFECYDPNKGAIIGWEDVIQDVYYCQTTN